MIIQANMVVGGASEENQSSIWPSFWLLGESYRDGDDKTWPMCGEIDIFENASSKNFSIPAVHFGASKTKPHMLGGGEYKVEFDRGMTKSFLNSSCLFGVGCFKTFFRPRTGIKIS
jgi:hypothetical protein